MKPCRKWAPSMVTTGAAACMVVLGSATWMRVTGMTRVWPVDELVMETEAEAAAWG